MGLDNLRKPPPARRTSALRAAAAVLALNGGVALSPDLAQAGKASEPLDPTQHSSSEIDLEVRLQEAERKHIPKEFWNGFRANESVKRMPSNPGPRLLALLAQTPANELSSFWSAVRLEPALAKWLGVEALRDAARRVDSGASVLIAAKDLHERDPEAMAIIVDALDTETIDHLLRTSHLWNVSAFWSVARIPGLNSKITRSQVILALEKTQRKRSDDQSLFTALREDGYSSWSRHISRDDLSKYLDRAPLAVDMQEEFVRCLAEKSLSPLWGDASREYLSGSYAPVVTAQSIEKSFESGNAKLPPGAEDALRGMAAWQKRNFQITGRVIEKDTYLQMVRTVNHAHVFPSAERATLIAGLNAEQLYNMTVQGESELYVLGTSAFRDQIAPALLTAIKKEWGGDFRSFLEHVDPHSDDLAQFLRVAATFAKGGEFFGTEAENLPYLLRPVIQRIDTSSQGLHVATVLLDLLMPGTGASGGLLPNPFTTTVENILAEEFTKGSGDHRLVLGMIGSLYAQYAPHDPRFAAMRAESGAGTTLETLTVNQLFTKDEQGRLVHTARMYFFPGADGEASYDHFLTEFKSWNCSQNKKYTECVRTVGGKTVRILMNNPRADLNSANETIDAMLSGKSVNMLVMRGHSGSVSAFIDAIRAQHYQPAVVHMGACGAFSHLAAIFEALKMPTHVISTRGTGSMTVNDPVLAAFYNDILSLPLTDNNPFRWDQFGKKMKDRFAGAGETVRAYADAYQFPHRNHAAALLYSVSKITGLQSGRSDESDTRSRPPRQIEQ